MRHIGETCDRDPGRRHRTEAHGVPQDRRAPRQVHLAEVGDGRRRRRPPRRRSSASSSTARVAGESSPKRSAAASLKLVGQASGQGRARRRQRPARRRRRAPTPPCASRLPLRPGRATTSSTSAAATNSSDTGASPRPARQCAERDGDPLGQAVPAPVRQRPAPGLSLGEGEGVAQPDQRLGVDVASRVHGQSPSIATERTVGARQRCALHPPSAPRPRGDQHRLHEAAEKRETGRPSRPTTPSVRSAAP